MTVIRVVAWPGSPNPYQRLLHAALRARGVRAEVLHEPTGSHTVNLFLLPGLLVLARLRGARILHLHWVYDFVPPWMQARQATLRAARAWYAVVLGTCRLVGLRIVWTAHNVLPHDPVFADDVDARRLLLRRASGVVLHSEGTRVQLAELGLFPPPDTVVAPHGPYEEWVTPPVTREQARRALGWGGRRVAVFFGRVNRQKGADELVDAFAEELGSPELQAGGTDPLLVVAGRCTDDVLARHLLRCAAGSAGRIQVDLRMLPEEELQRLVVAADVVVTPFRSVTTSGSVILALSLGVPVVVPDLPAFEQLPPPACVRYVPGRAGLRAALHEALTGPAPTLSVAEACRAVAGANSWSAAAERTAALYRAVLGCREPVLSEVH